ncbi:MAG TPA: metallophosphoesterase [Polyangiaceae bacterium]|nr:metallophosphoesterase [Polyangiaceae bacterium]
MSPFVLASLAAWALVVILAGTLRSRAYAMFRGVTLGLQVVFASAIANRFAGPLFPVFVALHATVFVGSLSLVRPRPRSLLYRTFISLPAAFFSAGTLLALPWVLAAAFGYALPGIWLPYAFAFVGIVQSLSTRSEVVDVHIDREAIATNTLPEAPVRVPRAAWGTSRVARPLRLVQITDPHLGPFMSARRLERICRRAVEKNPDLVLLTGDFLTMESQSHPELLARALSPLRDLPGRVFACLGNHDHEALGTVRHALDLAGARLLVDSAEVIATDAGLVQIIGFDFTWRDRAAHLRRVSAENPRLPSVFRLALLHDPGAFRHLPPGEADLVLSGHTHGGQVGFVSLGLPWTLMRLFARIPDHGLWARGADRLYVHRGTGHYGFPLRLGVPAEESLLAVHAPALLAAPAAE